MDDERTVRRAVLAGLGLLAFAFVWPRLVGGQAAYSDEDAAEFQSAAANLHDALHRSTGLESKSDSLEAAQERFRQAQAARDDAEVRGQTVAAVAKWAGATCLLVGLCLYVRLRRRDS
jgi:hypothetical protein